MFKFHCPHCQQKLSAEATQSGATLQCPACGVDFVIPSPTDEVVIQPQTSEESVVATSSSEMQPEQSSQPEPSPEPGASHSFAERLRDGNKAAQEGAKFVKKGAMVGWAGLKRRSKQAALKAQIEKLRNIDLRKALHSLGKNAFEQGVVADGVAEQFQAIRDLDARIAEMRDKAAVDAGETKMAALKRVSKDTAKASQAQALTVKREHLITELGREIHARKAQMSTQELSDESAAIAEIEHRIQDKEDEMQSLDDGGQSGIQTIVVTVAVALIVVTLGVTLVKTAFRDPLERAIDNAVPTSTRWGNYTDLIEGRDTNGVIIYFLKGEKKPYTGHVKDLPTYYEHDKNKKPRNLYRIENGLIHERWELYRNGNVFEHATYNNPSQPEKITNFGSRATSGVLSMQVWMPSGAICQQSKVEGGNGVSMEYDERTNSIEAIVRYENGRGSRENLNEVKTSSQSNSTSDSFSSKDFDMGFRAGAIGSDLPYNNQKAYEAGRKYGEQCKSMPAYTQGHNTGMEEGLRKASIKSNPYNKISQKVDWLAWEQGYSEGHLSGGLSRAFQGSK